MNSIRKAVKWNWAWDWAYFALLWAALIVCNIFCLPTFFSALKLSWILPNETTKSQDLFCFLSSRSVSFYLPRVLQIVFYVSRFVFCFKSRQETKMIQHEHSTVQPWTRSFNHWIIIVSVMPSPKTDLISIWKMRIWAKAWALNLSSDKTWWEE